MSTPLISWIRVEPTIGLLLLLAIVLFFVDNLRGVQGASRTFWLEARVLFNAAVRASVLLAVILGFRHLLSDNSNTSYRSHYFELMSNQDEVRNIYGEWLIQAELDVEHFVEQRELLEISREAEGKPPLFQNVSVRHKVPQNSIVAFEGEVELVLSDPKIRSQVIPLINSFFADLRLEYLVVNHADASTITEFTFTLPQFQPAITDLYISVNGEVISPQLVSYGRIFWVRNMEPGQEIEILIEYSSTGMNGFRYVIQEKRQIINHRFVIKAPDRVSSFELHKPPSSEVMEPFSSYDLETGGRVITWDIEDLFAAPEMGMSYKELTEVYAPYEKGDAILPFTPNGFTLFIATLIATFIIQSSSVKLRDVAILCALYAMTYILFSTLFSFADFWKTWILSMTIGGFLSLYLGFKITSKLSTVLFVALIIAFLIAYPLLGLVGEESQQNSINAGIQVVILLYLFFLTLYNRLNKRRHLIDGCVK